MNATLIAWVSKLHKDFIYEWSGQLTLSHFPRPFFVKH